MRKLFRNKLYNIYIMSSRSLAAARARRGGEQNPPVSGNRPITSIGSQAAFAQHMPHQPSNVRTARQMQPSQHYQTPQQYGRQSQQQQFFEQQQTNNLPFQKLSISDAIGLITLRLGRVEQWIIETDHEDESKSIQTNNNSFIPDNHKIIDNSILTSIINRLDSLEKNIINSSNSQDQNANLGEDFKSLSEQFKRMCDDVNKHTIELSKCSEEVYRFNRELTETKDILKTFMVKYDMFAEETTQNFSDYEAALGNLEKRFPNEIQELDEDESGNFESYNSETNLNDIDTKNSSIMSVDLKNIIKQELANS